MAPSRFADRLGYVRWLYHLVHGAAPTHAAIGAAVGRSGVAVSYWMDETDAPTDYRLHAPLSAFFGAQERWLVRGEGDPPRPELWAAWMKERTRVARMPVASFRPAAKAPQEKKKGA